MQEPFARPPARITTPPSRRRLDFARGNIRIPGTRDLDPVVVLQVRDSTGKVLYDHDTANDLKKEQVVNAGSRLAPADRIHDRLHGPLDHLDLRQQQQR